MHVMTQRFVLAFERSISRVHKLPNINKKHTKKLGKGHCEWKKNMCGMQVSNIKS